MPLLGLETDRDDVVEEIYEEVSEADGEEESSSSVEEVEYIYEIEYVEESEDSEDAADRENTVDRSGSEYNTPSIKKDPETKYPAINILRNDVEDKQDVSISPVRRRSLSPIPSHRFIEESRLTPILSPCPISPRSRNVCFSPVHSVLTEDDEIIYVDENDDIFSS